MFKEAQVPEGERKANERKAEVDTLAANLLNIDRGEIKKASQDIIERLHRTGVEPIRLVLAGGAGSGKTTLSGDLSDGLMVPVIDLDEYIKGGWTADRVEYEKRLTQAVYDAWDDLPARRGWVVEHVESCGPDVVSLLRPNFAVLLDPGPDRVRKTAQARNEVGTFSPTREKRAIESMERAKTQFNKLPGDVLTRGKTWVLKRVSET